MEVSSLKVIGNWVLGRVFGLKSEQESGKNYITVSLMIHTPHKK
jgi:hypothetical protein